MNTLLFLSLFLKLAATAATDNQSLESPVQKNEFSSYVKRDSSSGPNAYVPVVVTCPADRPRIRHATQLSNDETRWLATRKQEIVEPLKTLLSRLDITGLDTNSYLDSATNALPNIGIAFSGGGYRALMNGAGALAAFDSRTKNSTGSGHLGGLLQSATYVSGLSGGSWLVGSIYMNNFASVQDLQATDSANSSLWAFDSNILKGPVTEDTSTYYSAIADAVTSKLNAGFMSSLTDFWGQALSFQLIDAPDGATFSFSSVANDTIFSSGKAPMPFIVAIERQEGEIAFPLNSTVFEFNPFEMGSFDPTTYAFAPLKYIGSNLTIGTPGNNQTCVQGYDNAGFIMGTSSSLFNTLLLNLDGVALPDFVKSIIKKILLDWAKTENDVANYSPNPFIDVQKKESGKTFYDLTLADGGLALENIPLQPLIQPQREVDVIFAVDSSADTLSPKDKATNWPNGTALVATYQRSLNGAVANGTAFPAIPDVNTFINRGLNNKPTFFGCNRTDTPLVVYMPNAPYTFHSNTSTFTMEYSVEERNAIIQNGYNMATMGNGTVDNQWPTCVGCAILSRSFNRTRTQVPDVCKMCFDKFCWDGKADSKAPAEYLPAFKLTEFRVSTSGSSRLSAFVSAIGLFTTVSLVLVLN